MRLLDTTTLELHDFPDATRCPPYAILSHVWITESSLQDLLRFLAECRTSGVDPHGDLSSINTKISEKIVRCCAHAKADGYAYVWIDTCCIDKTSSAELSEAINSMGEWYAQATVCYVYLFDVDDPSENPRGPDSKFRRSKWFTRGWTLQELIFPRHVIFFSAGWHALGTKASLCAVIKETAGITERVLTGVEDLHSLSVAARMVWASRRETTRVEDEAYSLLGIFGVYMPIIYGEGRNAFIRLQEEILKRTSDQSVFAWGPFATLQLTTVPYARNPAPPVFRSASPDTFRNLLAPSPTFFADCADIRPLLPTEHRGLRNHKCVTKWVSALTNEYPATPRGLRTRFPILPLPHFFVGPSIILALLPFQDANERILSLVVKRIGWSTDRKVYRITNDLDDFPDLYSRTCQLSFSVRCPEGCGPSRIRIVALDPAVFELAIRNTLVFMQPTELYIQVTGPMRPQIPIQDTQSLSRDKNSVNTIIFPPWLKQHAQNSRFDVSAYKYVHPTSGEEPGVGVQDMEKAVVLAVPAPSFAGDLLIVHFRGIHDDLSADEPNPWDVTLVVAQALGPRPFARMSTKLPGVFSVAALKSPSASQHAPDALWPCLRPAVGGKPPLPPHVEQLPAWDEDSYRHLYPLDDIEPGLCLTVTFWESPGHGTATGKGGSGRAERCYTMDVVFEHHLPLSRPTTDPPLMSESRSQADSAELDDRRQMDSSPAPRECGWMQMCLSAFRINKNREHNRR